MICILVFLAYSFILDCYWCRSPGTLPYRAPPNPSRNVDRRMYNRQNRPIESHSRNLPNPVVQQQERPGAYQFNGFVPYEPEFVQRTAIPEVAAIEIPIVEAVPITLNNYLGRFVYRRNQNSEVIAEMDEQIVYSLHDENIAPRPIQVNAVRNHWFRNWFR